MYSALYDALPQELLDAYEELKIHQEFSRKSLYGGYGVFLNEETDWNLVRDYGVIVVDAQFLSEEDIKKLREQGNEFILSYINVGSLEEFRPYYEEFADLALGEYEHWEDEQWVDAGNEKWQAFILETLAPELLAKGIDGFFVDNCDVYYQFPTDEILQGLADMMSGLVATGKQVIINGGDVFLDAYTEKLGEWYDVVTGINQEMVFTWMDYDNNMVRARIMNCDENDMIYEFEEKPAHPKSTLASMGIYIFTYKTLRKYLLADDKNPNSSHDFGHDLIPAYLNDGKVLAAWRFKGYWKDVGTVDSLWESNMDLLKHNNELDLGDDSWKIYTEDVNALPQYIGEEAKIDNSYITQGSVVLGTVKNSVLGTNCYVGKGAKVIDTVVNPGAKIGEGAKVTRCIVADDVEIAPGAVVGSANSENIELIAKKVTE